VSEFSSVSIPVCALVGWGAPTLRTSGDRVPQCAGKTVRKQYFLSWYFDFGRALVREWGRGRDIWGIPRPYFSILKKTSTSMAIFALRWMLSLKPQQRFFYKAMVWWQAGQIAEMYRLAARPK
jgi:hypothetical protein